MVFNITEVFHKTKENIQLKEQEFSSLKANRPWLFSSKLFSKFLILRLAYAVLSLSILLFKSAGESFIIFTKQPNQKVCPYSYVNFKKYQYKVRLFSGVTFATIVVFSVIISLIVNLAFGPAFPSKAETYTFNQTSWNSLTSNTASHSNPSDRTSWNQFSAKDTNLAIVNASADLQLSTTTNTWTVTDDGTTDTGFNNTGAATSDTVVSGTGSGAGVTLSSTISGNTWTTLTAVPGGVYSGGFMLRNGADNDIYVMQGGSTTGFYKYSISGNSWTTLTVVPAAVREGSFMLRNGADNDIYVMPGNAATGFYKYSISGNSWTTLTAVPGTVYTGGFMLRNGADNDIYVMRGGNSTGFYKYSISGNSWTTLTAVPGGAGWGGFMLRNGADNDIYVMRGGNSTGFYKYSISGNSWTTLTAVPAGVGSGGFMLRNGADNDIYVMPGNAATGFYKYSISGNSWTTLTAVPAGVGYGGFMLRNGADNDIYVMPGNAATGFYKYSIATVYQTPGAFTSHIFDTTGTQSFGTLSWTATTPAGTSITIKARSGNQSNLSDATAWGSCTNITSGAALSTGGCVTNGHQYIQFQATLSTTDTTQTPTLSDVSITYTSYPSSQTLTSSGYNSTDTANVIGALSWIEDVSLPTGTGVTISLRTATSDTDLSSQSWSDFTNATTNCSKTTGVVSCPLSAIPAGLKDGSNDQWWQYKVALTSTGANTPTFSDIVVSYVINGPPVISNLVASQGSDGIITATYDLADPDNASATIGIFADIAVTLSDNPLSATATSDLTVSSGTLFPSSGTVLINTEEISYTGKTGNQLTGLTRGANSSSAAAHTQNSAVYIKGTTVTGNVGAGITTGTGKSITWTILTDLPNVETNSGRILVYANDGNLANQVGTAQTSTAALDTKAPALATPSATMDASVSPANLNFAVTDLTALQSAISLASSDLSSPTYVSFVTNTTVTLVTDPDTVYYRFKDAKGNQTSIQSITSLETPAGNMVQDVSNVKSTPNEYQLFIAWKVLANPSTGFKRYNVYRSTDDTNYSLLTTQTNRTINYYLDTTSAFDTLYYYKVTSQDNNNNISYYSTTVSGKANGAQDAGEGGGGGETTTPTVTNLAVSNITTQSATITWDTNELADSTIAYEASLTPPVSYTSSQGVPTYVTTGHSVVLKSLTPNTKYYIRVKSTDPSNNTATCDTGSLCGLNSSLFNFTTQTGVSITANSVTTTAISNTGATITWKTNADSDSHVVYSTSPTLASPTTFGSDSLVGLTGSEYIHKTFCTINLIMG